MEESKTAAVKPTIMKAIVIGVSDYKYDKDNKEGVQFDELPHCARDAEAVAQVLQDTLNF
jgi:hypothetical protein